MTVLTDQPIQTLLELVQQHKLDPWDIDIEKLTHVYLERVLVKKEPDLRTSGRALLSASVLLRIKSDYVLNGNVKEQKAEEELDDLLDLDFPDLGQITIVQHTPRKITLIDLLGALQEALAEIPAKKLPKRKKMGKLIQFLSEYDVNIERHLNELYKRITTLAASGARITLFTLAEERTRLAVARTLLLLLFLYVDGKVVLEQPELFSDILVSLPKEEAKHGG
ncbi:MAG: segregation/condensation protein A [Candidatus Hodarchaeaceae archaeon]|nr:segregation/condensation protein A [Candidatus Hodarchaeaceae archaeon]